LIAWPIDCSIDWLFDWMCGWQRMSDGWRVSLRQLPVNVLWSRLHFTSGSSSLPLRVQVLLVLLRQVQDVLQACAGQPMPLNAMTRCHPDLCTEAACYSSWFADFPTLPLCLSISRPCPTRFADVAPVRFSLPFLQNQEFRSWPLAYRANWCHTKTIKQPSLQLKCTFWASLIILKYWPPSVYIFRSVRRAPFQLSRCL